MSTSATLAPSVSPSRLASDKPISIAILAMGGQGGGVLSDWIVALAESQGWAAQSTSVPGVAQRTGATIYYIEMLLPRDGKRPILSLMPTPGDVDVVLAAEFMEAGRAMLRGLVTPERTTLIASSHRSYAVVEKQAPGDGIGDPAVVTEAARIAAKRIVTFDMQSIAEQSGSVISAVMFGALASVGALPFPRSAFEQAIRSGGKGVSASIAAFSAGYERTHQPPLPKTERVPEKSLPEPPSSAGHPKLDSLLQRLRGAFPRALQPITFAGVKRLVEYQGAAYAHAYLDRLERLLRLDAGAGGAARDFAFTREAAKYLAVAMAYDDVVRVADLKTRSSRFARVRHEIGTTDRQIVYTTEYMHPRMEELAGALPAAIGRFLERHPRLFAALDRRVSRGRRVRTGTIFWFLILHTIARTRVLRPYSLRHGRELAHIERWLAVATTHLSINYELATEIIACRRLVKGYSDTHARGSSKFERLLAMVPRLASIPDGAAWLRRLRQAALMDENGEALAGAIKTIEAAYPPGELHSG